MSKEENIVKWIKGQMISWLGHLGTMEEDRMPKKIFTQELEGTRRRGRPRKGWKEEVGRDLQVLGVRRWRKLVMDRKKMEGYCSTGQSPQWTVVPMEEEEEEERRRRRRRRRRIGRRRKSRRRRRWRRRREGEREGEKKEEENEEEKKKEKKKRKRRRTRREGGEEENGESLLHLCHVASVSAGLQSVQT